MASDAEDSDAENAPIADEEGRADCFTDSDDSDASSEDFEIHPKDPGIARDGHVWTLPSIIKSLRHKEDTLLRLEALQHVYHLVLANPPELAVRCEELFRQVLYADVPDWSRPENTAADAKLPAPDEMDSWAQSLGLEAGRVRDVMEYATTFSDGTGEHDEDSRDLQAEPNSAKPNSKDKGAPKGSVGPGTSRIDADSAGTGTKPGLGETDFVAS